MVGRGLSSDVTDHPSLRDKLTPTTKRLLTHLLDETEEDFQSLIKICEDFGVEVYRPEYSVKIGIDPYLMNPRDEMIVLDKNIVAVNDAMGTTVDLIEPISQFKSLVKRNKKTFGLMPPSIVRLGNDIILDKQTDQFSNEQEAVQWLRDWLEPLGYNIIYTPTHDFKFKGRVAHSDATLSLQKPGVLLCCIEAKSYTENIFKGWDSCEVASGWDQMSYWTTFKSDTKAYVFEDSKYLDPAWNKLCTTWLSDWAGYAKETVFDVNVLSLDEKHVIVSNYNKEVFEFFKKHKIEPIISPWRHRWFWDGGIHCITLDLEREGNREQYL